MVDKDITIKRLCGENSANSRLEVTPMRFTYEKIPIFATNIKNNNI